MSQHEWEFGDWANIQNHRYRFLFANDELGFFLGQYQSTRYWKVDDAEYLPDCTGWDWQPPKPIEPPPGCRLLTKGETILITDRFLHHYGHFEKFDSGDAGCLVVGKQYDHEKHVPIARKIEPPPGETGFVHWDIRNRQKHGWVTFPGLEIDHIEPEFHGGSSDPVNLQLLCTKCNRSKGYKRGR